MLMPARRESVASALLSPARMSLRLVVSHPESVEAVLSIEANRSARARVGASARMHHGPSRRNYDTVGACGVCGVTFAGTTERAPDVRHVLGVHESLCPGGRRAGEIVTPFD
jgi:hypothetical protein